MKGVSMKETFYFIIDVFVVDTLPKQNHKLQEAYMSS